MYRGDGGRMRRLSGFLLVLEAWPGLDPQKRSGEDQRLKPEELQKLTQYLRMKFELPTIHVKKRPQKDDSAEVYIGDEFIGVLFRDEEDGELSYNFQMAILEYDLEG
jgi:hypothetical protein